MREMGGLRWNSDTLIDEIIGYLAGGATFRMRREASIWVLRSGVLGPRWVATAQGRTTPTGGL